MKDISLFKGVEDSDFN